MLSRPRAVSGSASVAVQRSRSMSQRPRRALTGELGDELRIDDAGGHEGARPCPGAIGEDAIKAHCQDVAWLGAVDREGARLRVAPGVARLPSLSTPPLSTVLVSTVSPGSMWSTGSWLPIAVW